MPQTQTLLPDLLPADDTTTPLMAQYLALKEQHKDCLVFFRLGDFYELFFDDAVNASAALNIALTRRGQHQGRDIPMCGVPAHAYEGYLAKLIRAGFRVALCEQTENPATAKKRGYKSIVSREVVRIVTPGTVTEDSLLDARAANHLACLVLSSNDMAIGWLDIASGQPYAQNVRIEELSAVLARIEPVELLLSDQALQRSDISEALEAWRDRLTPQPQSRFDSENARRRLTTLYKVSELASFGDFSFTEIAALGALVDYIALTQKSDLEHLSRPIKIGHADGMVIDPATRRNLELTRTLSGERSGSLLATIDRTCTGAGARLLAARLMTPLIDVPMIDARLDAVAFLHAERDVREKLRSVLKLAPDLERVLARLVLGRGGPRDLAAVRIGIESATEIRGLLNTLPHPPYYVKSDLLALGEYRTLCETLRRALADELPLLARDGNFIARGFSALLDEYIMLRDDSRKLLAVLQQKYAVASGVTNLKIRHNMVIGYYIEVTPNQAERLFAQKELFIHRQTLATAARFTTVELSEIERRINEAADKALALELDIFSDLVAGVVAERLGLRDTAAAIASLDVTSSLAELADEENYVRPQVDTSLAFQIVGGRHPVVEQALHKSPKGGTFVANDCDLAEGQRLWLLTGPNMAGKSTFLRQNALIALMAQIGSFVPATSCHIGIIDRLFSRVGAADDLARGRSTFMVEMVETAAILNQSGERALVILDEIGRGTATYDGLSIAWATLEHLNMVNKCRTLFATHYHELTALAATLPELSCHTMRIKEWHGEIIFLHEAIPGVADRSYGIHVAQMAGLPAAVIARATDVLVALEADSAKGKPGNLTKNLNAFEPEQAAASCSTPDPLTIFLSTINPDEMTPKAALAALYQITALHRTSRKP